MTGPGYPTYTENPYEGGVDQVVPTDALSSSGLAALAAKTQQDWQEELFGAFDTTLNPLSDLLGKLFDLFSEFVDIDGFVEIASDVLGFFYNLLDRAGFFTLLEGAVALFGWLTDLGVNAIEALVKPLIEFLTGLWNFVVSLISGQDLQALIEQVVNFLGGFLSGQGFADVFKRIVQFFSGLVTVGSLPTTLGELIEKIPLLKTLVATITGKTEADGSSLDLGALGDWARTVERDSKGALKAITDLGVKLLGGTLLPPPNGGTDINLLSQGDFAALETIEPADGWSWDNTTSASGSGGSAKLVATGSAQRLYSKQSIPVKQGDVITMSARVKTSGFSAGTERSMAMSIVPWNGTSRILDGSGNPTSVQATPRTTSAADWVTLSGSYTIPAGVSSVQARLAVTANSGAIIWFDDISIKKKSEMGQDYVNNLIPAWRDIYFNATGSAVNVFWDAVGLAIGGVRLIGANAAVAISDTNLVLFNDGDGGSTIVVDNLPVEDIGDELGVALPTGSGGRMYRAGGTALVTAAGGPNAHAFAGFYTDSDSSADITRSTSAGSFTVTHSGYYQVEVGFTVNAVPEVAGAFNVAPAVFVGGSLYKVGAAAFGSYAFGLGGYGRSAQSTFIVYLNAGQAVTAGYYNWFAGANGEFFAGGAASTYFSIAMLNRTDEG